ncbi:calcium sensing receptor, chloroplastic-like isoform X2 [Hibiscus syriacus]|uniref:calcium sensing receptor, chloroplastic-like isoform X2 n=1 Tax=Hibiscus syriacus TaxID=106335 RepID=UPI001921B0FD|nr:calcium sensing receptor, chloroplastic-like isoform X2 [Hibiscus syriacus]
MSASNSPMAVQMAIRVSATARLSLPPPSSPSVTSSSSTSNKASLRTQSKPISTSLSLLALLFLPHEAKAISLSKEQIVSSLTEVEKTIDQVQEAGSSALDVAQQVFDVVGKALKPAIDAGVPIAKKAGEEALKVASPVISEASKKAQEAIQGTGLDSEPVLTAAKTAAKQTTEVIDVAKPLASSTFETITSAEPLTIVGSASALFVAYLLLPPIWSFISYSLRGYKGDLTPAQALDLISTQNYVMVDIRSEKDKDRDGVPRLPSSAKKRMIAIPLEELPSKLRSLVRNTKKVEAEIVALKISYLKKISKGSNIVIMDSYCDSAKTVARTLTSLGFNNCFVVADGFSGSKGWLQSRLGTDTYNFSAVELLSPSTVFPTAAKRFGTTSTKFLPGAE